MPPIVLPDPPLSDGVITLRAFTGDDIPAITAACQDPEIARWTAMVPSPYTEEDARGWIATHDEARSEGLGCPFAVADAATGGLLAYAPDTADLCRRAAIYVDRVLRGTKINELPVQLPTKFQLVVNLKIAKAIGLTIPETLLARADEVIE